MNKIKENSELKLSSLTKNLTYNRFTGERQ